MSGTRTANILMSILIALLVVLLSYVAWAAATGRTSSHDRLLESQVELEAQMDRIVCLLATDNPEVCG